MLTINNYIRVKSLEEAYELNKKKGNIVLGGMVWLKMGNRTIQTAIDLSDLGLNTIEEDESEFRIGTMCSLRDVEVNASLESAFGGQIRESLRHIVGVQFRNTATIGGSIFGRFGFSDILTCLLALDTYVELYDRGIIPLAEFVVLPRDNDILVRIIIKKDCRKIIYQSFRRSKTDFPVLASAVSVTDTQIAIAIGARPKKAALYLTDKCAIADIHDEAQVHAYAEQVASSFSYGTNMRGSAEYRKHLAAVTVCRALEALKEEFA